jgi:hypothetical protein
MFGNSAILRFRFKFVGAKRCDQGLDSVQILNIAASPKLTYRHRSLVRLFVRQGVPGFSVAVLEETTLMKLSKGMKKKATFPMVAALLISVVSGIAAFAQADLSQLSFSRVETELRAQMQTLKQHSEPWAKSSRSRAEFALIKIQNARMSGNPAVENMHLRHACEALAAERSILIEAQSADTGNTILLESLVEQTFTHREILGCLE